MNDTSSRSPTLLPNEASTVVSVVGFLFGSSGALVLLVLVVGVIGKSAGWEVMRNVEVSPLAVVIRGAVAVGYLWTAWLLFRGLRLGGYIGVAILALSFVPPVLAGHPWSLSAVWLPLGGAVALALSWPHLSARGKEIV